ncbi:MAG TPA: DUF2760 domain-containing protein [Gemmataceae bacterium]|jgi:hypothetical protein|nr:DUF2760 domain-containing protein [Gemmataceae bacterium]
MEPMLLYGLVAGLVGGAVLAAAVLILVMKGRKPAVQEEKKPAKPSGAPLRLLALLQREGRLVDFLMEDISAASDQQIGFGVREIHRNCQQALKKVVELMPVLPQEQDADVTVSAGFDPSAIRLTGNVAGQPPFHGKLKHPGWRVKSLKLAAPPEGVDEFVLMPAEVEM